MLSYPLDLTGVLWEAEHTDGNIIRKGPQRYPLINRNNLETFSLTYHNKPILLVHPKGRTLVVRLKTLLTTNLTIDETTINMRAWIVALLAKPKSEEVTQHVKCEVGQNVFQYYDIDKEDTNIYYIYENGKQEIRNHFGPMSPYLPLHLRPDEYEHLMGVPENVF